MKAYSITYKLNGHFYTDSADAINVRSAIHKIGRKYGLDAKTADRLITLVDYLIVGYY